MVDSEVLGVVVVGNTSDTCRRLSHNSVMYHRVEIPEVVSMTIVKLSVRLTSGNSLCRYCPSDKCR